MEWIDVRRRFPFYLLWSAWQKQKARAWIKSSKAGVPPHWIKQQAIKDYAQKFSLPVFIETGTYWGDMVFAVKDTFSRIISIELDDKLYERARKRFYKFNHIAILHGDSAQVLPQLLLKEKQPVLFWLDGHFSGGMTACGESPTPILDELEHIFNSMNARSVVLIDDARLFMGVAGYPALEEVKALTAKYLPQWIFQVTDDIIRIHAAK